RGQRPPHEHREDGAEARDAVGGREHDADGGGIEQQDDAKLEQAQVVAGDPHAGCLSTASRDRAGLRSPRGRVRRAIDSIPAQTRVAIATCRPLKSAASVKALPAPTATWATKTIAVATAT